MSVMLTRRAPAPYQPIYSTFEDAERRVELLQKFGYWPGIMGSEGCFTLTHDVPLTLVEIRSGRIR